MLTEAQKSKAVKGFKLQLNGALGTFNMYGLGDAIPGAIEIITELALLLHKNLNGADIPVTYDIAKEKARRRRR